MKRKTQKNKPNLYDRIMRMTPVTMGRMAGYAWNDDPKHVLFTLSRYKFVAKMLAGRERVLEIGCADAFGTRLVRQSIKSVTATDIDPGFIADVKARQDAYETARQGVDAKMKLKDWSVDAITHDLLKGPVVGPFDAAYALDVLEHIPKRDERRFMQNLCASLTPTGIAVLGMPSLPSQVHASELSREGHVNCKTGDDFKEAMERYFHTVFVFSMNDEVVHTGFYPMAHYLLAVCSHLKDVSTAP